MKRFLFIRHGKTKSNIERRYAGSLCEPLCPEGKREAEALAESGAIPDVADVIAGSALRCRQTADILFPRLKYSLCGLREIDFGLFKNKNADDLLGDMLYEKWLKTGCMGDIPGGDSVTEFKTRCCAEFVRIAEASGSGVTAIIAHGGSVMAILERYALPKRSFYDYSIKNCGFKLCRYVDGALYIESEGGVL